MSGLYLTPADARPLARRALGFDSAYDERWLQDLVFRHPALLPMHEIDPGASPFIPICTELSLRGASGQVRIDLLGVAPTGKLVVVECKLWRNPEARREVIGQLLEYASLLGDWDYADLEARLKHRLGWTGENPLYYHVRRHHPDVEERRFVDRVQRSLETRDFCLVIVGDGIRSDANRIAALLEERGGLAARLALVEIQLWSDDGGGIVVIPTLPLRTEVVRHRVLVDAGARPLALASPGSEGPEASSAGTRAPDAESQERRAANRRFWDRFIHELRLDHPDQQPPRHHTNNAVRLPLPAPAAWMTVYRTLSEPRRVGVFVVFSSEMTPALFERLTADGTLAAEIEAELGAAPETWVETVAEEARFRLSAEHPVDITDPTSEAEQLRWAHRATNVFVNALRPRLQAIAASPSGDA